MLSIDLYATTPLALVLLVIGGIVGIFTGAATEAHHITNGIQTSLLMVATWLTVSLGGAFLVRMLSSLRRQASDSRR